MDMPPEVQKAIPGAAGSLTALLFFRDGWRRAALTFIAGATIAKFLGPSIATVLHSGLEVAGYVTGLFGLAIVSKVFDMVQSFDAKQAAADAWAAVVKRIGG